MTFSFRRIYQLGSRFPKLVCFLAFVTAAASFFVAKERLKIDNDLVSLLPEKMASLEALNHLKEHFGGQGHLFVTVESGDPQGTEGFADLLAAEIRQHPAVLYVDHRRPFSYFLQRKWLYLDHEDLVEVERRLVRSEELKKKGVSAVFSGLMDFAEAEDRPDLSLQDLFDKHRGRLGLDLKEVASEDDGRFLFFRVKLKENPQNFDATQRFMGDVRRIERQLKASGDLSHVSVGYTGTYQKMLEQRDLTRREIAIVSGIVALLLFLILYGYFGRLNPTLLVAVPVTLGVLWTGGLVALFLGHLNVITSFAAIILAGLGSDYGIYLLSRFEEERQGGADFLTACERAFSNTGRATRLSMITTVGAFAALCLSDFQLFVEFGIVGALGLVLNYLAMMLLVPACLTIEHRLGWEVKTRGQGSFSGPVRSLGSWMPRALLSRRARFLVLAVLLGGGVSVASLPTEGRLHFDDGQVESRRLPSYRLGDRISRMSSVSMNPTALIVKGPEEEARTVRQLESILQTDPEGERLFDHLLGLTSFVPEDQGAKKGLLRRIRERVVASTALLENQRRGLLRSLDDSIRAETVTPDGLPQEVRRLFRASDGSENHVVYLYPSFARTSAETMRRYHEGVERLRERVGGTWEAADGTFISDDVIREMERESPRGLGFVLLSLAVIVLLFVRPRKRALVILGSLAGSLVLLSGVLWFLRIPLNIINIAVIPVILGTGVDCFIHMSERFSESRSLRTTLGAKVVPILVSNLTTIVGFGGLILTSSAGIRSAGWVAVLGIVSVTLFCLLVFTRWLAWESAGRQDYQRAEAEAAEA